MTFSKTTSKALGYFVAEADLGVKVMEINLDTWNSRESNRLINLLKILRDIKRLASFQSSLKLLEGASAFQIEKEFGGVRLKRRRPKGLKKNLSKQGRESKTI